MKNQCFQSIARLAPLMAVLWWGAKGLNQHFWHAQSVVAGPEMLDNDFQLAEKNLWKELARLLERYPSAKSYRVSWRGTIHYSVIYDAQIHSLSVSPKTGGISAAAGFEQFNISRAQMIQQAQRDSF